MTLSLALRVLEILIIVGSWFAAAWIFRRIERRNHHSLSYHSGSSPATYRVFAITLGTHAVVFWFLCVVWLIPRFELPVGFFFVMTIAAVSQLLTGIIRDGDSPNLHKWHSAAAYLMAATMPVLLLFLVGGGIPFLSLLISWLAIAVMALVWVLLFIPGFRPYYLIYQSAYILLFDISIIAIVAQG